MRVLVTGGSGFVGGEIVEQLHRSGYDIRALVRDSSSKASVKLKARYDVELVRGNILDPSSLDAFFSSGDAIIHLVGIISEVGRNTFESVHHFGTRNVVDASLKAGVRRFIHMSALGTRPNAVARYHRSKWEAEEVVRQSGLDYTIFRPSIIYGPGDMFTNMFSRMARWSPILPVIGDGKGTVQPIPVQAVAECFVKALSEPAASQKTFDLVGPEVLTMNEVIACILKVTERRALRLHIPVPIARTIATFLETFYSKVFGKAPPLNRDQVIMLQERTVGESTAAKNVLGMTAPQFIEGLSYLRRR